MQVWQLFGIQVSRKNHIHDILVSKKYFVYPHCNCLQGFRKLTSGHLAFLTVPGHFGGGWPTGDFTVELHWGSRGGHNNSVVRHWANFGLNCKNENKEQTLELRHYLDSNNKEQTLEIIRVILTVGKVISEHAHCVYDKIEEWLRKIFVRRGRS